MDNLAEDGVQEEITNWMKNRNYPFVLLFTKDNQELLCSRGGAQDDLINMMMTCCVRILGVSPGALREILDDIEEQQSVKLDSDVIPMED